MSRLSLTTPALLPLVWGIITSSILLGIRYGMKAEMYYFFLPYNLVLALIPFILAWWMVRYSALGRPSRALLGAAGIIWLLFFPNAPYIVTDFIHLAPRMGVPVFFDFLLILSFAATGLVAGWYSLYLMQGLVSEWFDKTSGWVFVVVSLTLASFGVYLGRFLRWNSWDLFMDPVRLAADVYMRVLSPSVHMRLWLVAGLLLGFFIVSYASFVVFIRSERGAHYT